MRAHLRLVLVLAAAGMAAGLVFAQQQRSMSAQVTPVLNPANGHFYEAVAVASILWIDAKAAAESRTFNGIQGHLATITSQEENDFIVSNFPDAVDVNNNYWLGGFQPPGSPEPSGGWEWVTGEPFVYTNWASGEPNDVRGGEDSLHFWKPIGKWNDDSGTMGGNIGYVVEYDPSLDHFQCYEPPFPPTTTQPPITVQLEDQFGSTTAQVGPALHFCAPVEKTRLDDPEEPVTVIQNEDNHLAAYLISAPPEPTRTVRISNQFGDQVLRVDQPQGILVPTQKIVPGNHGPPEFLDHFKCYDAAPEQQRQLFGINVHLTDQFTDTQGPVLDPFLLCNPVRKVHNGEVTEVVNPEAHLVCYGYFPTPPLEQLGVGGITEPLGALPIQVTGVNQFGTLARIHRWTGMDGVRAAEGGEGVTGAMIRGLEFG